MLHAAIIALTPQQIACLALASLVGGLVFGVTGFAFGVVASIFLHHAFAPKDVIFMVVSGGFVLNLAWLPRFFREVRIVRALPFMVGATFGMPLGLFMLSLLDPRPVRIAVGVLIEAYCGFALYQQRRLAIRVPAHFAGPVDVSIGFAGGIVGGAAGLGPLIPGIWYGLLGLGKREQRSLAQPFGLYVQAFLMAGLIITGAAGTTAVLCLLLMAPFLLLSSYVGLRAFDRIGLLAFQRLVLGGCIVGGLILISRQLG